MGVAVVALTSGADWRKHRREQTATVTSNETPSGERVHHFDLELLTVCRDVDCERQYLHAPHGKRAAAIVAPKRARVRTDEDELTVEPVFTVPRGCGVPQLAVDLTYEHITQWVPRSFGDVLDAVRADMGSVHDRTVQKGIRLLVDARLVASLGSSAWAPDRLRSDGQPGWYIRYDSPKLWSPGGLRDLMDVVAENGSPSSRY